MSKYELLFVVVLSLLATGTAYSQSYVDWVRPYTGESAYDYAYAVTTDSQGNSYVTGESAGIYPASDDFLTIKYDPDGKVLWTVRYDGPGSDWDVGRSVVVDGSGNVFVAGQSTGVGSNDDFTVVKYDSNGNFLWDYRYSSPGTLSYDRAVHVSVDASGNAYASGSFYESPYGYDAVLVKLDPDGTEEWTYRLDSSGGGGPLGDHGVKAVVAPDGNVRFLARFGSDLSLTSITPAGVVDWEITYDSDAADLSVDASSNSYVTGDSNDSGSFDWTSLKVTAAGVIDWTDVYDGPASDFDVPYAISAGPSGEAYVTGLITGSASLRDLGIIKYDALGNREWVEIYDGPANDHDKGVDIAYHPDGGCAVTGIARNIGWTYDDIVTMKYDANGNREWLEMWDDGYGLTNEVEDLALDSNGNVFITGKDPYDYFTIKYRDGYSVDVEVLVTPRTQPIELPSSGGSLDFNVSLRNNTAQQQTVDAGVFLVLPSSTLYGPLEFKRNINLSPGQEFLFMNLSQSIPSQAPAGEYAYQVLIGYNSTVIDQSQFFFTKL